MTSLVDLDVSRETILSLETFLALLVKWNQKINLVSPASMSEAWQRHIADSAQVFHFAEKATVRWADLGSGGGFPGIVVAILAKQYGYPESLTLIESDARKCAFLQSAKRELDLPIEVVNERIELSASAGADVVSARALADLSHLFEYGSRHVRPNGRMIFLKGKNWETEVEDARSTWRFDLELARSKTSAESVILCATGVTRV